MKKRSIFSVFHTQCDLEKAVKSPFDPDSAHRSELNKFLLIVFTYADVVFK